MYIAPEEMFAMVAPVPEKITSWFNFLYFDQNTFWGEPPTRLGVALMKKDQFETFCHIYDPESVTVV